MDESEGKILKPEWSFGIFSWFGFDLPLRERLALIAEAGFSAASLWWGQEECCRPEDREASPGLVRAAGLHLESIHVPYKGCHDFWHRDKEMRERITALHLGWLEDCARHGAPVMVMHLTNGPGAPGPTESGVDAIARLVARAEELGVTIALENTEGRDHLDMVLAELISDRLGLCYDASHDCLGNPQPFRVLKKWGHRLAATHLSDNDGSEDRHWLPGEGSIDWSALAKALPLDSYSGWLSLEVLPKDDPTNETARGFLAKARARADWLGGLLMARIM